MPIVHVGPVVECIRRRCRGRAGVDRWALQVEHRARVGDHHSVVAAPPSAQHLIEQPAVGARRRAILSIVRTHDAVGLALLHPHLVLRQVSLAKVEGRDRVAVVAAVGLAAVGGEVLEVGQHLGVAGGVHRVHALGHCRGVGAGQKRVLSWQLGVAAEARVSRNVDVRAEPGDARVGAEATRPSVVVERADLGRDHVALLLPCGPVEGGSHPGWPAEDGRAPFLEAHRRHRGVYLEKVGVGGEAEPRHRARAGVARVFARVHAGDLLGQVHRAHQVRHALRDRQRHVAVGPS